MKVRVLVLAPFRYVYGSKNHFVTTGEDFYLDTDKEEEYKELLFLSSSFNDYSQMVHIEKEVLAQLSLNTNKGEAIPDLNYTQPPVIIGEEMILESKGEVPLLDSNVSHLVASILEQENKPSTPLRDERERELLGKIRKDLEVICKSYNITYSTKSKVIQDILDQEYTIQKTAE
ncbi:hypothetical protein H6G33_09370 [Calothrix sp. FACHB-1219]|uniref:hypothetical protein n=1 Tax=unclassified Calothrix TaxID=2619626 RepID=UPI0016870154|nr:MULTISPECIES: hypothetical protein [unclassified Calothrix]MBD2201555.1 hypothetical protein [Calothrix sp. FACHB-168]MBD2217241.1 hypothetical protein [Calothrix sp. FACHB-1219]